MDKQTVNNILNQIPTTVAVFKTNRVLTLPAAGQTQLANIPAGSKLYNMGNYVHTFRLCKFGGKIVQIFNDADFDALMFMGFETL